MLRAVALALVCFIGGCTASIATLFIPVQVETPKHAKRVPMGWPVPYVFQDMSGYDPPSWPNKYRVLAPQEHPSSIHLGWFAFSVLLFSGVFAVAGIVLRRHQA